VVHERYAAMSLQRMIEVFMGVLLV